MSNDKGWDFLNSNDTNDIFYSDNDGSWGYKDSDGSASYYGADGSWGYKDSDGSGSYYGADGSWGYKDSDGSGSYYGADGNSIFYDANDDEGEYDNENNDEDSDSSDIDYAILGMIFLAKEIAKHAEERREQDRLEEQKRLERKKISEEKRKIRREQKKKERSIRNKRVKAFLINKKNLTLEFSTSDLIGNHIDSVVADIKEAGFNHYKTFPIQDIHIGNSKYVGEVEQVVINGQSWLAEGTPVPYDAEVFITYHAKKRLNFPYSPKQMTKKIYTELSKELMDIGFTEVYTQPLKDLITGLIKKRDL